MTTQFADKNVPHAAATFADAVTHGIDTLTSAGRDAIALVYAWNHRRHERRTLAELDDHLLRDIGVDRHQALTEASKPFWQA